MTSGGARARSGPAPDPDALRRNRSSDGEWLTLDPAGCVAEVPEWPLSVEPSGALLRHWERLWSKPQSVVWEREGVADLIAAYVVAFDESVQPGAAAGLKTAVLRMEAELGISIVGMRSNRWRFGVVAVEEPVPSKVIDGRSRFQRGSAAS